MVLANNKLVLSKCLQQVFRYNFQYLIPVQNIMGTTFKTENLRIYNKTTNYTGAIDDIVNTLNETEPFYICDIGDVIEKYEIWNNLLPRIKPFYAVKVNNTLSLIKTLAALGTGFDCATRNEMELILSLGVSPDRIIYAHTIKSPSYIKYAAKVGVTTMTFDSTIELQKMKDLCPDVRAVIRIKYDSEKVIVKHGSKFGCDADTEALELLTFARKLGVNVVGVSFHVGYGCHDPEVFHGAIAACRRVFTIATKVGFNLEILNLGGGFPGDNNDHFKEFADVLNFALNKEFSDLPVTIMAEPGQYFVKSAFHLACSIILLKETKKSQKLETSYTYFLNDGIFGNFSGYSRINTPVTVHPLKKPPTSKLYHSILYGPTCNSLDKLTTNILLPKLSLNDWLIFKNMGSYSATIACLFNGFPFLEVYTIINQDKWINLKQKYPSASNNFIIEEVPQDLQRDEINCNESYSVTFNLDKM